VLVFTVAIGVAIGAGVETLMARFTLLLLAVLFDVDPPQATPKAPVASTAMSAIFFIVFRYLLSSSK
jgi:hypothetical protein